MQPSGAREQSGGQAELETAGRRAERERKGGLSRERGRVLVLGMAILALLAALWAGWLRIGWNWPAWQPGLLASHGPLMISGFFGTLISLERAVALRRRWPYLGPVLSGLGGLALLAGVQGRLPPLLLAAGSLGLVAIFAEILRQHRARYTLVMAAGALAWLAGNLLWLAGRPISELALWWAAFLILTVAGERLELGRLRRLSARVENLFMAAAGLFLAGLVLARVTPDFGARLAGLGLLGLAAWLGRYDLARRTVRQAGLPRFAAVCLLSGYVWLGSAGLLALLFGAVSGGVYYDALLHAIFLGFTFAMIFGHAPIIFPAILGLPIQYTPLFYAPLAVLHASLLLRIAGDLARLPAARMWGGLFNGVAILLFLALTGRSILLGRRGGPGRPAAPAGPPADVDGDEAFLVQTASRYQVFWWSALACFLIAGTTGALMRLWLLAGFPVGVDFANVRHAHSHLMYFAWITPALMALIAARLPAHTGRPNPRGLGGAIAGTLVLGLLSYPPFFAWGYEPAEVAGMRLPLAVIFSSLNMLAWYLFMLHYRRATYGVRRDRPLKLWTAALVFLFAASLGAWGRAILVVAKIDDPFFSAAAVHLFLDLFSSGWAVLGLLGLAYAARPGLARSISGWEDPLLFLGLPLSFLLGLPVDLVPPDLRTLAGLGGLAAAAGLALHIRRLWPAVGRPIWGDWGAPLALLLVKAGLDAAASLSPLARWGEALGLRILYLHVLLLGGVSLGLLAAAGARWQAVGLPERRWMAWAVSALLASLLPLTGLWPAALSGRWALSAAFVGALGPVVFGLILLVRGVLLSKQPDAGRPALRAEAEGPR